METTLSVPSATAEFLVVTDKKTRSFSDHVQNSVQTYFNDLEGDDPHDLYALMLA